MGKNISKEGRNQILLWGITILCILFLLFLCFDKGIDYDESYSYSIAQYNRTPVDICKTILDEQHSTDVPLYYMILWLWRKIFGSDFFVYRIFSLLGTIASMLLGVTYTRKKWGNLTAAMYIVPVALAPAMVHVSVNIRMYSWTVFLITACALLAHSIAEHPEKKWWRWVLLYLTALSAMMMHYFAAFYALLIYAWLFFVLLINNRRHVCKLLVCGLAIIPPFIGWMMSANLLYYRNAEVKNVSIEKVHFSDALKYVFGTRNCVYVLGALMVITLVTGALMLKKYNFLDLSFVLLLILSFFVVYFVGSALASLASHFFTVRHIMHGMGMLWLGIAIAVSRINVKAYISAVLFTIVVCTAAYMEEFHYSYDTTPYLDETINFIESEMKSGDIVIHNAEYKYTKYFKCYMPEQKIYYYKDISDLKELEGRRVWFLLCRQEWFPDDVLDGYDVGREYLGHYGFQTIYNCTEFELLKLKVSPGQG